MFSGYGTGLTSFDNPVVTTVAVVVVTSTSSQMLKLPKALLGKANAKSANVSAWSGQESGPLVIPPAHDPEVIEYHWLPVVGLLDTPAV
jgi:hypothetical protein